MPRVRKTLWMMVLALAGLVVLFAPEARAAGRRLVAQIEEPFVVNGQLFPPGELSVRELGEYSPVAKLDEVQVDGRTLGYVVAHELSDDRAADTDALIFARNQDGQLVLQSVAVAGEPTRKLQALATYSSSSSTGALEASATAGNGARAPRAAR